MSDRVAQLLARALDAHHVPCRQEQDHVLLANDVAFRAHVAGQPAHGNQHIVQLNVGTVAPLLAGRVLWQSFAGIGGSVEEAEKNAFAKFLLGPFHAMLSALANHHCDSCGSAWTEWRGTASKWSVCDSPLLAQGVPDASAMGFDKVVEQLERAFVHERPQVLHWGDVFFAFLDGKPCGSEVNLDGAPWPEGLAALQGWPYQPPDGYVSGRYFFIAVPAA